MSNEGFDVSESLENAFGLFLFYRAKIIATSTITEVKTINTIQCLAGLLALSGVCFKRYTIYMRRRKHEFWVYRQVLHPWPKALAQTLLCKP